MTDGVINSRCSTIWLADGIVHITHRPGAELDVADAREDEATRPAFVEIACPAAPTMIFRCLYPAMLKVRVRQ